jgi:hypothetical protein
LQLCCSSAAAVAASIRAHKPLVLGDLLCVGTVFFFKIKPGGTKLRRRRYSTWLYQWLYFYFVPVALLLVFPVFRLWGFELYLRLLRCSTQTRSRPRGQRQHCSSVAAQSTPQLCCSSINTAALLQLNQHRSSVAALLNLGAPGGLLVKALLQLCCSSVASEAAHAASDYRLR